MAIGRLVRDRMMRTESKYHFVDPTVDDRVLIDCQAANECCLSACVLVLAAGAEITPGNIGLHRFTSAMLGEHDYATAKGLAARKGREIAQYLDDMEMSPKLYAAMMAVPSIGIALLDQDRARDIMFGPELRESRSQTLMADSDAGAFVPSVHEWLAQKCKPRVDPDDVWGMQRCLERKLLEHAIERARAPDTNSK